MKDRTAFYRPELDWLRFVAFGMVFLFHIFPGKEQAYTALGFPRWSTFLILPFVNIGCYGVDLFFALSAFLITTLLLLEKEQTGTIAIRAFYIRRILRIWPLYYSVLAALFVYTLFCIRPYHASAAYYAALFTFTANWYVTYAGSGAGGVITPFVAHLWTVSVEEQFYLIWPALMKTRKSTRFAAIMVCLIAIAFTTRFYLFLHDRGAWYHTLGRLDSFACGGLLAIALHGRTIVLSKPIRVSLLAISAALFWKCGNYCPCISGAASLFIYPTIALASTLTLFAFIATPALPPTSVFLRGWSYLGKISYGLYVFHWPVAVCCWEFTNTLPLPPHWLWVGRVMLLFAITLLTSMVSYALLEKPFLRLKRRFTFVDSRPV